MTNVVGADPGIGPIEKTSEQLCQEYLDGWKRALADYENIKRDLAKEKIEMRRGATINALETMMPAIENLELAVKQLPADNWAKGFQAVHAQFVEALKQLGGERYGQIGETFDSALHEALGEKIDEQASEQTILEVLSPGWKIGDYIIRPAKVIINSYKQN
jgi:molecular chaperone GrpE